MAVHMSKGTLDYIHSDLRGLDLVVSKGVVAESIDSTDPLNYSEAVRASNSFKWFVAMEEEMDSLNKNETCQLVKPSTRKKIVGDKWVFKRKEGSSQGDTRYKARLVVIRYSQVKGVDFHDVFFPVMKHTSIRALLALVASNNLELE
ncbi:copia LTR rider [Gossypium australe]|uniref:Copia LTR rider n=1 Tax=Gossypium australe TaxID=47621 RepID=A0A5B6X326_9ROSI|nr:copia LTR rider [Gossypium australe]